MTLTLDWGDFDETFLVWNFEGSWSAEDFYNAIESLKQHTTNKSYDVNVMVDMRRSLQMPKNLLTLLRGATRAGVENVVQIVVITPSNFWVQMYEMLIKTVELDPLPSVTFVRTVDDAYGKLGNYALND